MKPTTIWLALALAIGPAGCSKEPAAESGTVQVGACEIPYVTEGQGIPCMIVGSRLYHGKVFSAEFKAKLRCTFVDIRVFIPQAPVDTTSPYTIDVAVEDIEAVRKALRMPRFVLVGHSITGTMVMAYARKYPQNVSHVIAIGAPTGWSAQYVAFMDSLWKSVASLGRQELYKRNYALLTPDSLARLTPTAAFVAGAQADAPQRWYDSTYNDSELWTGVELNPRILGQLFDLSRTYSLLADTAKIDPPVFLAIGRFDFYGGAPASVWANHRGMIPHLTIDVFEKSGHTPQLEEPAAFDKAVFAWLDKVGLDRLAP